MLALETISCEFDTRLPSFPRFRPRGASAGEQLAAIKTDGNKHLADMKAEMSEAHAEAAREAGERAEQERKFAVLDAALEDAEARVLEAAAVVADRDAKIAALDHARDLANGEAARLAAALVEQEHRALLLAAVLARADASLTESQQQGADLERALAGAAAGRAELTDELARREAEISALRAQIEEGSANPDRPAADDFRTQLSAARVEEEASALRAQIVRLEDEKQGAIKAGERAREDLIAHFRGSTSWRLTAPMRAAMRLLKREKTRRRQSSAQGR